MKQLQLFEARSAPKRKLTRKRIEREAAKAGPWSSTADSFHIRPKLPDVSFFRTMVVRGLMTFDDWVKIIPQPRAIPRTSGRMKGGRSVLGQVNPLMHTQVEDIGAIMVRDFDADEQNKTDIRTILEHWQLLMSQGNFEMTIKPVDSENSEIGCEEIGPAPRCGACRGTGLCECSGATVYCKCGGSGFCSGACRS